MTPTQIGRLRTLMDDIERTQEPNKKAELRTYVLAYLRATIDGIPIGVPLDRPQAVVDIASVINRTPPAMSQPAAKHEGKPCCGSKQHRHKKDCPEDTFRTPEPEAGQPKMIAEDFDGSGEPLTEDEFDEVRQLKSLGKPSMVVASKLAVRLIEVNRAFSAPDYDWYIEHR